MKQVTVNLFGNVTFHASRSFIIELPDDLNVATLDQDFLEVQADIAKVAWDFSTEGLVQATSFTAYELRPGPDSLPIIPLLEKPAA